MTDGSAAAAPDLDARHHALIGLHSLSGSLGGVDPGDVPGFRPSSPGADLRTVAEATEQDVTVAGRLGVLHDLASAGFPHYQDVEDEYRLLAASVASVRDIDADQLLSDLKESATEQRAFDTTATGRALPHRDTAFVGADVCHTRSVQVGELAATWVFSEIETDAPFAQVADWVDPRSWPERGPMMFKGMSVVGADGPTAISGPGDDHWHGVFHEQVQLVRRLSTLLHCDFWRDGDDAAGMTYELALSLDNELNVDRGFLSVNDLGDVRRVKALKIVGFTEQRWNEIARMVCPFWTDWVRGAVQGGSSSRPRPPSHVPGTGPGSAEPGGDVLSQWFDFVGESTRTYLDLASDLAGRATSGGYGTSDWVSDGSRYWSQLAKDWSKAWSYGLELLDDVAREGLDASVSPPGAPKDPGRGFVRTMGLGAHEAASGPTSAGSSDLRSAAPRPEGTTVPTPQLLPDATPRCSPLVSIEAGGATIPADEIRVSVRELDETTPGVHVESLNTTVAPGLYVGHLETTHGRPLGQVQLYVSRALETTAT